MMAEKKRATRRIADLYLAIYNSLQAIGWTVVLFKISRKAVRNFSTFGAYDEAGKLICLLQLFAFMEVIHATTGLLHTGIFVSLMQWAGRSHVLFAIICQMKEIQGTSFVSIVFIAWSLSEVIRYPQYVLYILGACPTWLTWLRYTAFIPLYPLGVFGEVAAMYFALPFIQSDDLHGNIFKLLPFRYHSFVTILLVIYPILWLPLYMHMLNRRKIKLTNSSMKKKTTIKAY